jgi:hypothetical protein
MATVIVINPLGADVTWLLGALLKGTIAAPGDTIYTLPYTNQAGSANIANGVALLDAKLNATSGNIKVFCYSEGCQVATKWLRDHGTTSPITPTTRLTFQFVGNAERKYGGILYQRSSFNAWADTGGLPGTVPYAVNDFCRQYDGFADYPTASVFGTAADDVAAALTDWNKIGTAFQAVFSLFTTDATKNAANNTYKGMSDVHQYYFNVAPGDAENVTKVEGNVTYEWSPTFPLPLLGAFATAPVDNTLRTQIETQYTRPVSLLNSQTDVPPDYPGTTPPPPVTTSTGPGLTTVSAILADASGVPAVGYVQFEPSWLRKSIKSPAAGGGLISTSKIKVVLDGFGSMFVDLEPGDYNVAVVLQYTRTIYTKITVPAGAGMIDLGDLLNSYLPTQQEASAVFASPGNIQWTIPAAAHEIDYVLLGAGGGGDDGVLFAGAGGTCGHWTAGTLVRGVDIPFATQALSGVVGAGGIHRVNGGATTLSGDGIATATADGGIWGANTIEVFGTPTATSYGQGVDPQELNGIFYTGGAVQTTFGADGNPAGGGASGGFSFSPGGTGADGRLWLRAYTSASGGGS